MINGREGGASSSSSGSPYQILAVDPTSCSPAQLKAAFRARVEEFHPDVCKDIMDANAIIQHVIRAYEIRDAEQTCRNYLMKVRDLENQLADQKKAKAQVGSRDSAKYSKPPLALIRERQPLSRITNHLPPAGSRRSTTTRMRAFENKENILETKKSTFIGQTQTLTKARRISLSPIVRSIPVRRASIAILPSEEKHQLQRTSGGITQLSQLRVPRRMSVTTFAPLPRTPLAVATPDGKGSRFSSILSSSSKSKYSSPPNVQAVWKSKIPTFASP